MDRTIQAAEDPARWRLLPVVAIGTLLAMPQLTFAVGVIWGMTVVADSTAVSELAPPGTAASALAIQTALGFLLAGVLAPRRRRGRRASLACSVLPAWS
jgi:hypothetical protein